MSKDRYTVMTWARGNHSIMDTRYPIGDQRRRTGRGFKRLRDARAEARRLNKESE